MDFEADKIIADPSAGMEFYTNVMGNRLNEVYGAVLTPDQIAGYGQIAGQWVVDQGAGMAFGYVVTTVGGAIKKAIQERLSGREAPTPEEFRNYIRLENVAVVAVGKVEAKQNVTHTDGYRDER